MIGNPQGPGGSFRRVDKMFQKTGRRSRRRIATANRAIGADMRVMIESTHTYIYIHAKTLNYLIMFGSWTPTNNNVENVANLRESVREREREVPRT